MMSIQLLDSHSLEKKISFGALLSLGVVSEIVAVSLSSLGILFSLVPSILPILSVEASFVALFFGATAVIPIWPVVCVALLMAGAALIGVAVYNINLINRSSSESGIAKVVVRQKEARSRPIVDLGALKRRFNNSNEDINSRREAFVLFAENGGDPVRKIPFEFTDDFPTMRRVLLANPLFGEGFEADEPGCETGERLCLAIREWKSQGQLGSENGYEAPFLRDLLSENIEILEHLLFKIRPAKASCQLIELKMFLLYNPYFFIDLANQDDRHREIVGSVLFRLLQIMPKEIGLTDLKFQPFFDVRAELEAIALSQTSINTIPNFL